MLEKAKALLQKHRQDYMFMPADQKYQFHRQVRRLALTIDANDSANAQAVLVLDVIATRCNIFLRFKNEA